MLNLLSTSGKQAFIKVLLGRDIGANWADMVEQFTVMAVQEYRDGDPLELLIPERRPESGRYAVQPLAPLGQPTLWYGDGKVLKSYLLLACCRAMQTGEAVAGMPVTGGLLPAFLDWEWDQSEHADRLLRLGAEASFPYIQCAAPLVEQVKGIKRKLDKAGVDFIALDSLGLACGGDPSDPKIVLPFFVALRYLGRTAVIVHHVSKDSIRRRSADPYGSPYIRNSARAGWYFSRSAEPGEDSATVALQHRWTNVGRLEKSLGLRFSFDEADYTTTIARTDPRAIAAQEGTARERITKYLHHPKRDDEGNELRRINDVAEGTSLTYEQAKARLNDMHGPHGKRGPEVFKNDEDWYLVAAEHETG
jgi:hypothetical protein